MARSTVDAGFQERVGEFDGGGEVRLVGGEDVAAWVAMRGVVKDGVVESGGNWAPKDLVRARVRVRLPCLLLLVRLLLRVWLQLRCVRRDLRLWRCLRVCCFFCCGFFEGFDALGGDGPGVLAAALDGVLAHDVDVIEDGGAVAGGVVEHGAVVGLLVGDGWA